MSQALKPFQQIVNPPASIDMMRAAAGLMIPNHRFAESNSVLYTGSFVGDDGATWNRARFRDWFYYGNSLNNAYGTPGIASAFGSMGSLAAYMSTTAATTGESVSTNHRVLAQTMHTGYIPYARYLWSRFDGPINLAVELSGLSTSGVLTVGTHLKAFIGCYDSAGAFIAPGTHSPDGGPTTYTEANPCELVFNTSPNLSSNTFSRLVGHTQDVIPDNTHYIVLFIGINRGSGSAGAVNVGHVSLSHNPAMSNLVYNEGGDEADAWIDMEDVTIKRGAGMGWTAKGAHELHFLDGSSRRIALLRDQLRAQVGVRFHKVDADSYRKLLTLWHINTQGLGVIVPEPMPLVIDFGLGQLPHFGYYSVASGTFSGGFNPNWTLANQGFDIGMQLREI